MQVRFNERQWETVQIPNEIIYLAHQLILQIWGTQDVLRIIVPFQWRFEGPGPRSISRSTVQLCEFFQGPREDLWEFRDMSPLKAFGYLVPLWSG